MRYKHTIPLLIPALLVSSLSLSPIVHAETPSDTPIAVDTPSENDTVKENENGDDKTSKKSGKDTDTITSYSEKDYIEISKKYIKKYKKKDKKRVKQLSEKLDTYGALLLDIDTLNKQKRSLENKLENIEVVSDDTSDEMEKTQNRINLLIERINKKDKEKRTTETDISLTKKRIAKLENKLAAREEIFRERIKNSREENPFMSYVEILVGGSTFSDILRKFDMLRTISAEDNRIIEEYLALEEELTSEKKHLQEKHTELVNVLAELKKLKKSSEKALSNLEGEYGDILKQLEVLNADIEKVHQKLVSKNEVRTTIEESLQREWDIVLNYKEYTVTSKKIEGLNDDVAALAAELLRVAEENGFKIKVTEGFRSFEYQNQLYAQGRSAGGAIVTNARGGQSYHNYGVAFDIAFVSPSGKIVWDNLDQNDNDKDDWTEIGELGESLGLEWGGRWTSFVDRPHFQLTHGKSIADLYEEYMGEAYKGKKVTDSSLDIVETNEAETETETDNTSLENSNEKDSDM